jgi:tryptophan synthase alpha chain
MNTQNRIDITLNALKIEQKSALITFITAGDPAIGSTLECMHTMANNGVDIIELGVPFSDPMADGPTIQASSERAVKAQVSLINILDIAASFREKNTTTPIVLMGYANTFTYYSHVMGSDILSEKLQKCGIDGILMVDMPPEHNTLDDIFKQYNIHSIYLISPATSSARIEHINKHANGYIYYVAVKGVTGSKKLNVDLLLEELKPIQNQVQLPLVVGFGIDNSDTAGKIAQYTDGIVIGSKIINLLVAVSNVRDQQDALANFVVEIKHAMHKNA